MFHHKLWNGLIGPLLGKSLPAARFSHDSIQRALPRLMREAKIHETGDTIFVARACKYEEVT